MSPTSTRCCTSIPGTIYLATLIVLTLCRFADAGLTSFETDQFSGSGRCAFCHSGLRDEARSDVSIGDQWRSTMMANAAKDPFWQAKMSAEVDLQEAQALKQAIQEKCSRCHMGMARYQQMSDGAGKAEIYVLDGGFLDPAHALHAAAMDGVSCTLCHQILPENLGTASSFTGQYEIAPTENDSSRSLFGPYEAALVNPMSGHSGFLAKSHAPARQMADPAHCGTCHTLYTPTLDGDGNYLGEFPEQTTYLEWEHSQFESTCQDCHLPDAVGAVATSRRPRRLATRTPFGQHQYVGGNGFMVGLLKAHATDLGVTAEGAHLDATIARTEAQLEQRTATVTATAVRADDGSRLEVTVGVNNLAGHKLPTGFPSRRTWLHVSVSDNSGRLLFESGRPEADGTIHGNAADDNGAAFEPHYTVIDAQDQVQIYEAVMLNSDMAVTYTLLRAQAYAKDNRLLPAGFDKTAAYPDIGVYGRAERDADFTGGSDQVLYSVDVASAEGALTVRVVLLYQSLAPPFVADLETVATELVDRFRALYHEVDNPPIEIAATEITDS